MNLPDKEFIFKLLDERESFEKNILMECISDEDLDALLLDVKNLSFDQDKAEMMKDYFKKKKLKLR